MKRFNVHKAINLRVYILQNKEEFNKLSIKFNESINLMTQFINYSIPTDENKARL